MEELETLDQHVRLIWRIIPPEKDAVSRLHTLLVSLPSGDILEYKLTEKSAEDFPEYLSNPPLWDAILSSFVFTLNSQEQQ